MLCKCKLLLEASNREVQQLFKRVEDLRNFCAHPSLESDDWSRSMRELRDLVPQVHRMTGIIAETQEREWRVRSKDRSVNKDGSTPEH